MIAVWIRATVYDLVTDKQGNLADRWHFGVGVTDRHAGSHVGVISLVIIDMYV